MCTRPNLLTLTLLMCLGVLLCALGPSPIDLRREKPAPADLAKIYEVQQARAITGQ